MTNTVNSHILLRKMEFFENAILNKSFLEETFSCGYTLMNN